MAEFKRCLGADELPQGEAKLVELEGHSIALFNIEGTYYAIDNICTHSGAPLVEGFVEGTQVECPWHGAQFDCRTGQVLTPPAVENVASYKVRVNGSDVEIEI